ncbi:hypothetical protein [Bradyrhizobium sp. STM 3557]|uniref:hypothetical protein n=1 Tax=Bradyrhizobium sp. STM 3557 TaxID=578920 RepID=UPI00389048A3
MSSPLPKRIPMLQPPGNGRSNTPPFQLMTKPPPKDQKPGNITGDGFLNGAWHLAKP